MWVCLWHFVFLSSPLSPIPDLHHHLFWLLFHLEMTTVFESLRLAHSHRTLSEAHHNIFVPHILWYGSYHFSILDLEQLETFGTWVKMTHVPPSTSPVCFARPTPDPPNEEPCLLLALLFRCLPGIQQNLLPTHVIAGSPSCLSLQRRRPLQNTRPTGRQRWAPKPSIVPHRSTSFLTKLFIPSFHCLKILFMLLLKPLLPSVDHSVRRWC